MNLTNATPVEWILFWQTIVGAVLAIFVTGSAVVRLIDRYRDGRNGGVRMLAWERVMLSVIVTVGLAVGVSLSVLLVAAPARMEVATGPIETFAAGVVAWYAGPALLTMTSALAAVSVALFVYQWRSDRYYLAAAKAAAEARSVKAAKMREDATALYANRLSVEANTAMVRASAEAVQANTDAVEANTAARPDKEG